MNDLTVRPFKFDGEVEKLAKPSFSHGSFDFLWKRKEKWTERHEIGKQRWDREWCEAEEGEEKKYWLLSSISLWYSSCRSRLQKVVCFSLLDKGQFHASLFVCQSYILLWVVVFSQEKKLLVAHYNYCGSF